MSRIERIAFNGVTLISAALLVATFMLWAFALQHTRVHVTAIWWETGDDSVDLRIDCNGIVREGILFSHQECTFDRARPGKILDPIRDDLQQNFGPAGKSHAGWKTSLPPPWMPPDMFKTHIRGGYNSAFGWIPNVYRFSHYAMGFAALPLCWLAAGGHRRWKTRRDARIGCCIHCGYDLRASPGRCPECGQPAGATLP